MAFADQTADISQFRVGSSYSRNDIAALGKVRPPVGGRDPNWASGIVPFANAILLLVTLDKSDSKEYAYEDRFEGAMFWWQSQNSNTARTPVVSRILGEIVPILLFTRVSGKVRSQTLPFVYCGRLTQPIAEGERPVTVLFDNPDYMAAAPYDLAAIYAWRPTKLPSQPEVAREVSVRKRINRSAGQGRQQDPRVRKAVEMLAMRAARSFYEVAGYTLVDSSSNRPYDYVATKHEDVRRIEVKGTQGDGSAVILTANEVIAARSGPEPTDLFILAEVEVSTAAGEPTAAGGVSRILQNWTPAGSDLVATEYRYTIPKSHLNVR